jgi:hypothetical protein
MNDDAEAQQKDGRRFRWWWLVVGILGVVILILGGRSSHLGRRCR